MTPHSRPVAAQTCRSNEAEAAVDRAIRSWARARRTEVRLAQPWRWTPTGGRACVLFIAGSTKLLECGECFLQEAVGELWEVEARVFRALDVLREPSESHALLANQGRPALRQSRRF
jgi:hypothetical protein